MPMAMHTIILYFGLANQVASAFREYHMICKGVQGLKKFENPWCRIQTTVSGGRLDTGA